MPERLRQFLTSRTRREIDTPDLTPAAVLVPIIETPDGPGLLFTQRTEKVLTHRGQVSFPGGMCETGDRNAVATALREAEEEIGLPGSAVQVLGLLDDAATLRRGFRITPVAGTVTVRWEGEDPGRLFARNPEEVAEIFVVSIATLRQGPAHVDRYADGAETVDVPSWIVGEHRIWGATGRIVQHFLACADEAGWP